MQSFQKLSPDDVLEALGLQRRRSFKSSLLPTAAWLAAGAVVGATAAVLFAPKSGAALRKDFMAGAKDLSQRMGVTPNSVVQEVRDALPSAEGDRASRASAGANASHKT